MLWSESLRGEESISYAFSLSSPGGMAREAHNFLKRLADILSEKKVATIDFSKCVSSLLKTLNCPKILAVREPRLLYHSIDQYALWA